MIPTLPLRIRNRLAEVILSTLHDPQARGTLQALADGTAVAGWLDPPTAEGAALLRLRAQRAVEALARLPSAPPDAPLAQVLEQAAALFDAGLGFEVHELLESHWLSAHGEERTALQGLIQIAVGYQHEANGNFAGARALLDEGSAHIRGRRLAGTDLDPFGRAVAATVARVGNARPDLARPAFPRRASTVNFT